MVIKKYFIKISYYYCFRSSISSIIFPTAKHNRRIIKLCPTITNGIEINSRKFKSDFEKNTTARNAENIT